MCSEAPAAAAGEQQSSASARKESFSGKSQASNDSQTAAEFLRSQELLEADAREALPYSIEHCTKILGPLRQNVFACLTCNPPPATEGDKWIPAGVCYACSVQCHGEHTLVEIFQKRNFTCDCGTTRIPATSPCTLRTNDKTNTKGNVTSEEPDANNKYNHNFRNRFCGCECDYDPFQQKGTMFQCLGLGTAETGGCGEDWYHPGCLVGMGPNWFEKMEKPQAKKVEKSDNVAKPLGTIAEDGEAGEQNKAGEAEAEDDEEDEVPMPPGFPDEESFEGFICYKCVESNPWIKQYAGTSGFLPPVFVQQVEAATTEEQKTEEPKTEEPKTEEPKTEEPKAEEPKAKAPTIDEPATSVSRKRKADDDADEDPNTDIKRVKSEAPEPVPEPPTPATSTTLGCKLKNLPAAPTGPFSLFFQDSFRDKFCHCGPCFRNDLNHHPQLIEEEDVYEPPMSDDGAAASQHGGSTHGSGSLLERGESALRNVDRVRAIEGVMAYNHLKERLKPFFQQFADSGQAIGAEDIKAYFAKLRGDEEGIKEAGEAAASSSKDAEPDNRREQDGC